jgi:exonuclease VII small subunit
MTADDNIEDQLDSLEDLIRYLEKEKDRLKKCVETAAEQWEFSEAKAFAKAHGHIVGRLHTLKNLRDPGFDERAGYYRKLVFLEEQLEKYTNAPQLIRHLTEEIKKTNEALDKLEDSKYTLLDTQHIDDAIFLLLDGSIESFRLHLNKSEALVFDFACINNLLRIGLSYKKGSLFPYMKKRLRRIGFSKVDEQRRFVKSIEASNLKDAQKIKQLLAVVIFDVFGRSWFDNPAALEINYTPMEPTD